MRAINNADNNILDRKTLEFFKDPSNFEIFYHNALVSNSVLHLHITSKLCKNLKKNHVDNDFSSFVKSRITVFLHDGYMKKVNGIYEKTPQWIFCDDVTH